MQIKKEPADTTNSSASASSNVTCPYCMTPDFGIVYQSHGLSSFITTSNEKVAISTTSGITLNQSIKRKSIDSNHPDVVLTGK